MPPALCATPSPGAAAEGRAAGALLLGFWVLLCITGALTWQTSSPFSRSLFVLGFIILVMRIVGVGLARYDVDILSEWARTSFTVTSAFLVFVPAGALGVLTAVQSTAY